MPSGGSASCSAPRPLLRAVRDGRDPRPWETDELIDLVGLTAQADRRIASLSGGQRRRLDVAIGIVGRPELLFLDEPTSGFDPMARREFHELLGLAAAPPVLRRMARRESGSRVAARRERAMLRPT